MKQKNVLDSIRDKIQQLYEKNPNIHISISIQHPKLCLKNDHAVIKEVYPRVFRLEEYSTGVPVCHTVQYAEVLTKQIQIAELDYSTL